MRKVLYVWEMFLKVGSRQQKSFEVSSLKGSCSPPPGSDVRLSWLFSPHSLSTSSDILKYFEMKPSVGYALCSR